MIGTSKDFEKYGASYLISDENYDRFISGHENIGRPDGQFCIPKNQMDDLVNNFPNNPREWEHQLGLNEGSLGEGDIKRVDIQEPNNYNLRQPSADLSGANDKYLGTGKVPGGQNEAVIDSFPNPETHPEVGSISNLSEGEDETEGEDESEGQDESEGEDESEGQDESEGEDESKGQGKAGGESEGSDKGESSSPDSGGESAGNDYDYGYGY